MATPRIDVSGTTLQIDAAARVQSRATPFQPAGTGASAPTSNQKELTRNFDDLRYSVRSYVPQGEGEGYWDLYRVSEDIFVLIADCTYNEVKWVGVPGERCFKIRFLRSGILVGDNGQHYLADGENQAPYAQTFEPTAPIARAFADILGSGDLFEANLRGWFISRNQMSLAAKMLTSTDLEISRISQSFGFRHPGNFTQAFQHQFGHPPREYRRQTAVLSRNSPAQWSH